MQQTEQDARMKILLAAKKLFAKQGYDATSIRQISDEAGTNVALVSYYFGGKEKVFFALFETFFPVEHIREFVSATVSPVEGIKQIIDGVLRLKKQEPDLVGMFQHEIVLMSCRVDVIRQYAFPLWGKLYDLIEEGRKQGLFRFRSQDSAFMFVIGTMLFKQYDYFRPLLKEGERSIEDRIEDTVEFVFRGLGYEEEIGKKG